MQTPPAALPAPPATDAGSVGSWGSLAACVSFGAIVVIATDAPPGLAVSVVIATAAVIIAVTGRASVDAMILLAAAVVIGGLATLRASTSLLAVDLVAAMSLLAAGASFAHDGRLGATTARSFATRSWITPFEMVPYAVAGLAGPPRRTAVRGAAVRHAARLVAIVAPVVVVLVALLATADRAFATLVSLPVLDPGSVVADVLVIAAAAVVLAALLAATRSPSVSAMQAGVDVGIPWVRAVERVSLLVGVDLVFIVFVAIQFAVFFGGDGRIAEVDGLTYAEYARSGFWQLLAAAALAGGVLGFAWLGGQRSATGRDRAWSAGLSVLLVTLVVVVLVSAFQRLRLYELAYGYTPMRVLVHVTIIGMGLLLVCAAIAIVMGRGSWLPTAAVAIGVTAVIGLSMLDMEGFIAGANLDRTAAGHQLDVRALAQLSPDAIPMAVEALPGLDLATSISVRGWLACERIELAASDDGWAGANLARMRAREALTGLDLGPCNPRFRS